MHPLRQRFLFIVLGLALLSACGGGNGPAPAASTTWDSARWNTATWQ